MIPRTRTLLALLLLAAACSREEPRVVERTRWNPQPMEKPPVDVENERSSLIDLARGSVVVSRTGEAVLDVSAINALDGSIATFWMTPPHDLPQSVVIALAARSRIDRVGFRTPRHVFTANHVRFESSLDGVNWQPLTTAQAADVSTAQWFDVKPAEASYLRVTMVDAKPDHDVRLHSILAKGAELEPAHVGSIDGCWTINGRSARFEQRGGHAVGTMALGRQPIYFDGGTGDGRTWRFVWIRGNDYGYAAINVSPDGKHLSGIEWHEEAIPIFYGDAWFGEHGSCGDTPAPRNDVPLALLHRAGRASIFDLRFDENGGLLTEPSGDALHSLTSLIGSAKVDLRIVAHEFRQPTPRQNKQVAQREIAAVRDALARAGADLTHVTFVAAGSDAPRQTPETDLTRSIYSSIDVEVTHIISEQ